MNLKLEYRKASELEMNPKNWRRHPPRRPGDASQLVASWDKAHRLLGWQPEYPDLSSMIAHAWHWFQRYPYGYEK